MSMCMDVSESVNVNIHFNKNWKVILYDDPTTNELFIMYILVEIFQYGNEKAFDLMKLIERTGSQVIAVLPKKLAEKRVEKATNATNQLGFKDFNIKIEEED